MGGVSGGNIKDYLAFTAVESGTFKYTKACEYSLDGTTWVALAANTDTPSLAVGDTIMWRGTVSPCGTFSSTGVFDVSGNITSIKSGENFENDLTLASSQYVNFFKSSKVRDASALVLPATTLVYRCYNSMFDSCTSLIAAPALPATTLGIQCYNNMFLKCSNLLTAPDLLALTGVNGCYSGMFSQCTKLTYIKCLLSEQSNYTSSWTYLINTEGTFVKNPNATWGTGVSGVPTKWTIIDNE